MPLQRGDSIPGGEGKQILSSLSNTVEQIRPVNGFKRLTSTTPFTTGKGRETMINGSYRSWSNRKLRIISKTALLPRQNKTIRVLKRENQKALTKLYSPRSKNEIAPKRKI